MPVAFDGPRDKIRQLGVLRSISDKNRTTKCQEVITVESLCDSAAQHYLSNSQNTDLTVMVGG